MTTFGHPNLLLSAMEQRQCMTCKAVGLVPVPFGARCQRCLTIQVISRSSVPFESIQIGIDFYVVGHVPMPYANWRKIAVRVDGMMMTNAQTNFGGREQRCYVPGNFMVVVAREALIADRFSFN